MSCLRVFRMRSCRSCNLHAPSGLEHLRADRQSAFSCARSLFSSFFPFLSGMSSLQLRALAYCAVCVNLPQLHERKMRAHTLRPLPDAARCWLCFLPDQPEFGGFFFCDEVNNTPQVYRNRGWLSYFSAYYGTTYGARGARSHDRPPCHGNQAGAGAAATYSQNTEKTAHAILPRHENDRPGIGRYLHVTNHRMLHLVV